MYQRVGASDISPIHSVGVSIQLRSKLTLVSDIEIDNARINADIRKP